MRRLIGLGTPAIQNQLDINKNTTTPTTTTTTTTIFANNNNNNNNNITTPTSIFNNYNHSNHSTPSRPPRPRRLPLQERDDNATNMRMPLKASTQSNHGNSIMPHHHDKPTARPLMPTLSAAAQKASNKSPFTPRVVATANSTPTQPLRPRVDNRTPVSVREDISTPVSTFLNNNITPRSGKRKSRVDSTNTTPTGTPNTTPAPFTTQDTSPPLSGLGIGGIDRDIPKRPTVSFSPQSSDLGATRASVPQKSGDSKFFFASDAKNVQSPPIRPPLGQQKSSSFFYANGETIPAAAPNSSRSAVGSDIGEERSQPKFFHANGTPDLQASPSPHFAPPRPGSSVSTSSRMTSPRLANSTPEILSPLQRPTSPSKLTQASTISSMRNVPPLPPPIITRPTALGRGYSAVGVVAARRASLEGKKIASHVRSESGSSGLGTARISGDSIADIKVPNTPVSVSTTTESVSTQDELIESPRDVVSDPSGLQSPTKAGHSLEKMNELANNARRERKVLDLEITNSSLAAINRTLEREMRKQTAELRRYRRLSRSGRLSIATTASMRSISGTHSIMEGDEGQLLSDMSEGEEEEDVDEESDYSSMDDGSLSPAAMAESDLRHRKRDEQRLQLDLTKHQQLLIDSQKMNQSLKKCLDWTEELITEGKKALEYKVMVNDIKLGGRILIDDEGEDDNEGMSDIGAKFLREARLNAAAKAAAAGTSWNTSEVENRDSEDAIEPSRHELDSTSLMPAINLER